jgi:hypothetical protein
MRTFSVAVCLLMLGSCVVSPNALAQLITPVSQYRSVSAWADQEASADFGPFVASFSTNVVYGPPRYPSAGYLSVDADQNSEINASSIIASGQAYFVPGPGGNPFGYGPFASSIFSVTFTIDESCSYSLSGEARLGYGGGYAVVLSDSTGSDIQRFLGTAFSTNGTLSAGEYVIGAGGDVNAGLPWQSYNLDLELSPVPEPSTGILVSMSLFGLTFGTRCFRRRRS